MKWLLIGLGGLVVYQVIRNQSAPKSGGGFLSGGVSSTGSGLTGFVNSLSGLTNSIGKLFGGSGGSSTTVTDRDALINPDF